jgi:FkbM family methyltransferase
MKNIKDIWLPDSEEYLLRFANKLDWDYQKNRLDLALKYIKNFNVAIDIGSHCGLWSKHLVKLFKHVHAFEPVLEHRKCYIKNVKTDNYTLYPYALGNKEKQVGVQVSKGGSTMASHIIPGNNIKCTKLDNFNFKPDFIKLDIEGYEYYALLGAEKTIKKYKPTIILEQLKTESSSKLSTKLQEINSNKYYLVSDTAVFELLEDWGYYLCDSINEDYIFQFKNN